MDQDNQSGKEMLEQLLRETAQGEHIDDLLRIRAALSLAVLERGELDGAKVSSITKIINGATD